MKSKDSLEEDYEQLLSNIQQKVLIFFMHLSLHLTQRFILRALKYIIIVNQKYANFMDIFFQVEVLT